MKRWGLLALGMVGMAALVWAQTIHKETVVWDFVNGVKSRGQWLTPGGGGGGGTGDVSSSRTLTIAGTANQVSVAGGTQDLSADRTWTVSLATNPTLPGTTTGAFSGTLTGNASTATLLATNGTNCAAGQFAAGVDAAGNAEGCSTPAGGGDVSSNTATSVVDELALFANTSGKFLKRATTTGLAKLTAGVLSAAAPGTDYVVPGGNVATATTLAANGSNCPAGQFAAGVDAAGVAEGCANPLTGIPDPSVILTTTNVKKVTGKQNVLRVNPLTNTAGSVAFNCDDTDIGTLDTITAGITLAAPTCTAPNPEPEQEIEYRLRSVAPQTIAYNAAFCAESGIAFPTATSGDVAGQATYDRLKFRRNSVSACWGLIVTTIGVGRGVTTLSSATTFTCDWRIAHTCQMSMTGAAGTIVVAAPPAVPADGVLVRYKFLCTNLQTLDWATAGVYVDSPNVAFPTSCPSGTSKFFIVGLERSSVLGKYQIIATN